MLISFEIPNLDDTGECEYMDLTDIDRAVASFFGRVLSSFVVTDEERAENREFVTFKQKPLNRQLYVGQFDTVPEFLKEIKSKLKPDEDAKSILPACYISRDPAITYCDGTDYIDIEGFATIENQQGKTIGVVNKSFAKLNYTISALAWNKSTVDRLAIGLTMWLRHTKTKLKITDNVDVVPTNRLHCFKAKTKIANTAFDINIEINAPKITIAENMGLLFDNDRVNGKSFMFEVIAEIIEVRAVTNNTVSIGITDVIGGICE